MGVSELEIFFLHFLQLRTPRAPAPKEQFDHFKHFLAPPPPQTHATGGQKKPPCSEGREKQEACPAKKVTSSQDGHVPFLYIL